MSVSLDTAHRQVDLPVDAADFAIRMGQASSVGVAAEYLFSETFVPLASPHYHATGLDEDVPDWSQITLIRVTSSGLDWDAWLENCATRPLSMADFLEVDTVHLAQEAGASGLGVVIGRRRFIDEGLARGRLRTFSESFRPVTSTYWLVTPPWREIRPDIVRLSCVVAPGGGPHVRAAFADRRTSRPKPPARSSGRLGRPDEGPYSAYPKLRLSEVAFRPPRLLRSGLNVEINALYF